MVEEIDDSFYSRQRYVMGDEGMLSLSQSCVYICGLGGVGIEIAKNLALAGIKQLILDDSTQCSIDDCATQFFIRPVHILEGFTRAEASYSELVALNPYVQVSLTDAPLAEWKPWEDDNYCARHPFSDPDTIDCLVLTDNHLFFAAILDLYCHSNNIKFVYANTLGVMGNVFCDFGQSFKVVDATGEPLQELFIANITNAERALLTPKSAKYINLEIGTQLQFREVSGMTEINGLKAIIEHVGHEGVELDIDTRTFGKFAGDGIVSEIKTPSTHSFKKLMHQLESPSINEVDFTRDQVSMQAHVAFISLMTFSYEKRQLPCVWSEKDRAELIKIADRLSFSNVVLNKKLIGRIGKTAKGQVAPLCSVIGGIAAQEALKAVTHKFTPLKQWMYFVVDDILPKSTRSLQTYPQNTRYDPLAICIGSKNLKKLTQTSGFMVGCGAIGCELLKNLALMGMATVEGKCQHKEIDPMSKIAPELNNSGGNAFSSSGFPLDEVYFFSGSIEHIRRSFETFGETFISRFELAAIQRNETLTANTSSPNAGRVSPGFGDTAALNRPLQTFRFEPRLSDAEVTIGGRVLLHQVPLTDQIALLQDAEDTLPEVIGARGEGEKTSSSDYETDDSDTDSEEESVEREEGEEKESASINFELPSLEETDETMTIGITSTSNSVTGIENIAMASAVLPQGIVLHGQDKALIDFSETPRLTSRQGDKTKVIHQSPSTSGGQETVKLDALPKSATFASSSSSTTNDNNNKNVCCHCFNQPASLTVTDMDHIEKSNLNRQFLFRPEHVGLAKSAVAAKTVCKINPQLRINALQSIFSPETEKTIFTDEFLCGSLGRGKCPRCREYSDIQRPPGIVLAALDNVSARNYLDIRCIANHFSLFESGTMGTKGHVQTILPNLTESYSSQRQTGVGASDNADAGIPYCTLKSFPSRPTDCIEWAREKFFNQFTLKPRSLGQFLSVFEGSPALLKRVLQYLVASHGNASCMADTIQLNRDQTSQVNQLKRDALSFFGSRPRTWHDCLRTARDKFEKYFKHKALNLLNKFPDTATEQDGKPFWQLPRRKPSPIEFDISCSLHTEFVSSFACLLAQQLDITRSSAVCSNSEECDLSEALAGYIPASFNPSDKPVITDTSIDGKIRSEEEEKSTKQWSSILNEALHRLNSTESEKFVCHSIEFDKDDQYSGHINFMHSTSNLRALMYNLPLTSRYEVKRIAGRIIPAIATTTAAIAGLVCLEVLKYVCRPSQSTEGEGLVSRNHFLNLALPYVVSIFPVNCRKVVMPNGISYSLWDRWSLQLPSSTFTVADFMVEVKEKYHLTVSVISQNARPVFLSGFPNYKKHLTLPLLNQLVVSHGDSYLDLIVAYENEKCADTDDDDDIEGPTFRVFLPK